MITLCSSCAFVALRLLGDASIIKKVDATVSTLGVVHRYLHKRAHCGGCIPTVYVLAL